MRLDQRRDPCGGRNGRHGARQDGGRCQGPQVTVPAEQLSVDHRRRDALGVTAPRIIRRPGDDNEHDMEELT